MLNSMRTWLAKYPTCCFSPRSFFCGSALFAGFLVLYVATAFAAGGAAHIRDAEDVTTSLTPALCPVAAGNTWLASCLMDLGMPASCIEGVVPPGTCPGHFDIRPAQAMRLREARFAVFLDFQSKLAERLQNTVLTTTPLVVSPQNGLCIPDTYVAAATVIARALSESDPASSMTLTMRLERLQRSLDALSRELHEKIRESAWRNARVVSSAHQRAFCEWLGLNVIATLPTADAASPTMVERTLTEIRRNRAVAVIANLQEGTQAASAIASAAGVPMVIFSNFPELSPEEPDFAAMVRRNVARLLQTRPGGKE